MSGLFDRVVAFTEEFTETDAVETAEYCQWDKCGEFWSAFKMENIQTGIFYNVFLGIIMIAAQLFHSRNDILSQFFVRSFWFHLLHLYKWKDQSNFLLCLFVQNENFTIFVSANRNSEYRNYANFAKRYGTAVTIYYKVKTTFMPQQTSVS